MDRHIRRVLSLQLAILLIITVGVYALWGTVVAQAVWFGLFIAAINTLLIAWRMRPNNNKTSSRLNKPANLHEFFRSWLERYLMVGGLLALALGSLKLLPPALLGGFILGQLVWILAPLTIKET